jgi:hypothetical protein
MPARKNATCVNKRRHVEGVNEKRVRKDEIVSSRT